MRSLTLTGVAAASLFAIGLAVSGPASAAGGNHPVDRGQSLLASDADGSGADVRANSRMVAMVSDGATVTAGRAQAQLVADTEGSGADVRANKQMIAMVADGATITAGRAQTVLLADAEGTGADIRANKSWIA